jgi:DNA-binding response OmpR family regulator
MADSDLPPLILLVDAETSIHELATSALGNEGAVLGARTAALATKIASKRPPAIVVVDDNVADASPESLIAELRANAPHLRAIVLTSSREPEHTARLTALGPVLVKPLDLDRLRATVRSLLRLRNMAAGVERMKTGEFSVPESRRVQTRRERAMMPREARDGEAKPSEAPDGSKEPSDR